jgi:CTP:molybdopterin cytidylyltransferase MocA
MGSWSQAAMAAPSAMPARGSSAASILLAAGAGRRMGLPKAGLRVGGVSLAAHLAGIHRAGGVDRILVVLGAGAEDILPGLGGPGIRILRNPDWPRGQTTSLQVGLRSLPDEASAFLIQPVDHAGVSPGDIEALLDAWRAAPSGPVIVRPRVAGRGCHPVLYSRDFVRSFLDLPPERPAHEVYRTHVARLRWVDRSDPLLATHLTTPADFQAFLAARAASRP